MSDPPILGRRGTSKIELALSPALLVDLARDLLLCRGHDFVRRTDGPGDGGRDLASVAPDGVPLLTQCKHHKSRETTSSSSDVGQLVLAMIRLGYKRGLFVTDSRISPQAKREIHNDYPELEVDYLDFDELVLEVASSPVLCAAWLDGERLGPVNRSLSIPLIIRGLQDDHPVDVAGNESFFNALRMAIGPTAREYAIDVAIRSTMVPREQFRPYRPPSAPTIWEGLYEMLRVVEVNLRGATPLHLSDDLIDEILGETASLVSSVVGPVAVCSGAPSLVPLSGESAGLQVSMGGRSRAFIGVEGQAAEEPDWYLPHDPEDWNPFSDASTRQKDLIRFYNEAHDIVLNLGVETPEHPSDTAARQSFRQAWMKAEFALLPLEELQSWKANSLPDPDETIAWPPGSDTVLCYWDSMASIEDPLEKGRMLRTTSFDLPGAQAPDLAAIREALTKIKEAVHVDPERARHIFGVVVGDPWPREETTLISAGPFLSAIEKLPRPIDLRSRVVRLQVFWRTTDGGRPLRESPDVGKVLADLESTSGSSIKLDSWQEEHVVLTLDCRSLPVEVSTNDWLTANCPSLVRAIEEIERLAATSGTGLTRCTKQFWADEYQIHFGQAWQDSDRVYSWLKTSEGDLVPFLAGKGYKPDTGNTDEGS